MVNKVGDLSVWWIPQVPMKAFRVAIETVREGEKILEVLADYDKFQFDNNVKPDYCNAGGINRWESDGEGGFDWFDLHEEDMEGS